MEMNENAQQMAKAMKEVNRDINKINRQLKCLFKLWKAGIIDAKRYYERREEYLHKRRMIYDMYGI